MNTEWRWDVKRSTAQLADLFALTNHYYSVVLFFLNSAVDLKYIHGIWTLKSTIDSASEISNGSRTWWQEMLQIKS